MTGFWLIAVGVGAGASPVSVAPPVPVFVSSTFDSQQGSTVTSLTANAPASLAEGDLLLAVVHLNRGARPVPGGAGVLLAPDGWNHAGYGIAALTTNDLNTTSVHVYWKIAGDDEPGSYTFEWTNSIGRRGYLRILRITGADPTRPVHKIATDAQVGPTGPMVAPSVTTTRPNCLIFRLYTNRASHTLSTQPPGTTNVYAADNSGSGGTDVAGVRHDHAEPGATGTAEYAITINMAAPEAWWAAATVAIQPPRTARALLLVRSIYEGSLL